MPATATAMAKKATPIATAITVTTFVTVQAGGTLYIQEDFVPSEVVRALSEERIACALLVPATAPS